MRTSIGVMAAVMVILASQGLWAQPVEPGCYALEFDGQDDYVEIPHSASIKPPLPITICAWIKPVGTGDEKWIVQLDDLSSNYYGVTFFVRNDERLVCSFADGGPPEPSSRRTKVGETQLSGGEWHHVAAVLRGAPN